MPGALIRNEKSSVYTPISTSGLTSVQATPSAEPRKRTAKSRRNRSEKRSQ